MPQTPPPHFAPSAPTQTHNFVDERLLDAKLEAVEARTDSKFAQLMGKIDVLTEKIGTIGTNQKTIEDSLGRIETKADNTRVIIISSALAVVAILYGLMGYGHQIADSVMGAFAAGTGAKQEQSDEFKAGSTVGQSESVREGASRRPKG